MKWLKKLLIIRRQSDCVKLALLLFLAAAWFGFTAITQGLQLIRLETRPVEYVMQSESSGAVLDYAIEEIRKQDGIVGVSLQREYSIALKDKVLTVTELERQYLADCYDLINSEPNSCYWLSREAFQSLFGSSASGSARATYLFEEKTESGDFVLYPGFPEEQLFAVTQGNTFTLGDSTTIRVMFESSDPSEASLRRLETMGFAVLNQYEMQRQGYETELSLVKLRYAIITCFFALIGGCAFLKCRKMN